ncbi:gas vesicle protein GvpG [Halomarina ordinaria]|uniref:Gas vesicle protein GvpG n=1 Tax=Halomarina ordinaria TaxID=3033939 RepID=A0ABD5U9F2_9EURY|nr:protein gvpG [Halomarina sp. PSRA2]
MFILDDLLLRPLVAIGNVLHSMAIEELYDVGALRDELKENRLLFELGELSREEYELRQDDVRDRIALAEEAREHLSGRVEVKR